MTDLLIFIVSLGLLFYSGGVLVRSLIWMGQYLKLSEYFLSFILIAFATSLPELFVGIHSAIQGVSALSLGNLIGANVLNFTMVLGAAIVAGKGLQINRIISADETIVTLGMILFPAFLLLDKTISRFDGAALLLTFFGYTLYLLNQEAAPTPSVNQITHDEFRMSNFLKKFGIFVFGAALLLLSAYFVVSIGIEFAKSLALPLFFIGVLVAIGTTLPETVFSIKSVAMRHGGMSLGNAFGSIILNMSFILGLVALISPITIQNTFRPMLGIFLSAIVLVFIRAVSFATGFLPSRLGFFLLALALAFIAVEGVI